MNIASTRLNRPPKSPAVRRALDEGKQSEPVLLSLSSAGATSYAAGAAAYRNEGFRTLTKATTELTSTLLKAAFPNSQSVVEGVALAIGEAADIAGFLEDGSLTPGEVMDIGHLVSRATLAAVDRGSEPLGNATDGGTCVNAAALPNWLKAGDASIGLMAKIGNDVFSVPVTPSSFAVSAQSRDTTLAEMAKALGTSLPIAAAALQIADVLSNPYFWEALSDPSERSIPRWADA